MRNKSIQNTNIQTIQKVQRKDDRQTDRQMLRKFYSNLLGKENSTIYNIITHFHCYVLQCAALDRITSGLQYTVVKVPENSELSVEPRLVPVPSFTINKC